VIGFYGLRQGRLVHVAINYNLTETS